MWKLIKKIFMWIAIPIGIVVLLIFFFLVGVTGNIMKRYERFKAH